MSVPFRIGYGFDLHQWAEGRRLVLGGVEIPHEQGLLGHSDADALTHAIIDALLGALALGDIGKHFPDTDPQYKGCDSLDLLRSTMKMISARGYQVGNIDCTIVAERPKMAPHIPLMREKLAALLNVTIDEISIKATRTEHVLFEPEKGLLAMATALLYTN
ncbi:MAG: 2-C-methyl-D-erythritol 2,4-cyclodiphosphate synthase [bacterium]|nr:2-C-methyl-D-erythritol 2,4-cyclodiphosphate synthase [bacterium]